MKPLEDSSGWAIEELPLSVHVYPINDSKLHTLDEGCECCPNCNWHGVKWLVTHYAFDGREAAELKSPH